MKIKRYDRRGICKHHYNQGMRMSHFESSSSSQQLTPIFGSSSQHHPLTTAQRYAIIVMHLLECTHTDIAQRVNCHENSVARWIRQFNWAGEFTDDAVWPDRCTHTHTHTHMSCTHAHAHTHSHSLTHSCMCVCSYINNDASYWNNVLFTDEKHFALGIHTHTHTHACTPTHTHTHALTHTLCCAGSHGRAYVIRRAGEEYDEDKVVTYDTHNSSKTVHFWACFAASGVGDFYFFDDTLTSKTMIRIYKKNACGELHIVYSAKMQIWWLLYDSMYQSAHLSGVTGSVW